MAVCGARLRVRTPRGAALSCGRRARGRVAARAEPPSAPPAAEAEAPPKQAPVELPVTPVEEADEAPGLKPGQGTAIVTGAVSLILGGGYLYLASILNNREMLPPPPEALGM